MAKFWAILLAFLWFAKTDSKVMERIVGGTEAPPSKD